MPSYLTSDSLIASVKRRGAIPTSQSTFEDEDFLALANEEIDIGVVPSVLQLHEEFFVYAQEVDLVANTSRYSIPERAIGSKLRTIHYRNSSGDLFEMARVFPDDIAHYQNGGGDGRAYYYYLQNNFVVLLPTVSSSPSGSLAMTYFLRPNRLVIENRVGFITAIADATITVNSVATACKEITLDNMPSVFDTSLDCDLLETKGGHRSKALDLSPVSIDSTTKRIYFVATEVPDDLIVGDYIALSGECIIPQLPDDLHSMLAQRVTARCVEALGDTNALNAANAKLAEMEIKTGALIDNRTEGNPQKVVNLRGTLRSAVNNRRR